MRSADTSIPPVTAARLTAPRVAVLGRLLLAEAMGTFVLVFIGCGAVMIDARTGRLGPLGVAIAFGLAVAVMIAAVGHISGAHFNPAVTFALWARRRVRLRLVAPYIVAQMTGAVAATLALRATLGDIGGLGATVPSGSPGQAFVWECVLTAILVSVILAVATDPRAVAQPAALMIGATIALAAIVGGPVSGASLNPVRTLAPALAGGPSTALWVYLTAPFVGAAVAVGLFALLASTTTDSEAHAA